jgi:hypothetical protein
MSDYLWDKKGEPDTEVARLEALLGAFAHEPRPLELPAAAAPHEPRPARLLPFAARLRASRLFAPAALAAAAALLFASVLAASAFLRARRAGEGGHTVARETVRPKEETHKEEQPAPPQPERAMLEPPPGPGEVKDGTPPTVVKLKDEKVAVESLTRAARRRKDAPGKDAQLAAVPSRRPRDLDAETAAGTSGSALNLEAMSTGAGASSLVEGARLLTKEQLVYALRLTGAKLKDMREKAQKAEARP